MIPCGSPSFSRTMSACETTASPIHDGATTSVRTGNWVPACAGIDRLMPRWGSAGQFVERAAIRAASLAHLLDGEVDARVGVPELLRGQRAVQREVLRGDLDHLA